VAFGGNWLGRMSRGDWPARTAELASAIARLTASGKQVYLLLSSPSAIVFDPARMLERGALGDRWRLLLGDRTWNAHQNRTISRATFSQQLQPRMSEFAALAQRAGATVLDPLDWLCDGDACPYLVAGVPLYNDASHLRPWAVERRALFIDRILAAPAVVNAAR
jgi:hypothetical protein